MMRAAAFFDVDGTLLSGNVVRWYVNLVTLRMPATARRLWTLGFALRVPYLFARSRQPGPFPSRTVSRLSALHSG